MPMRIAHVGSSSRSRPNPDVLPTAVADSKRKWDEATGARELKGVMRGRVASGRSSGVKPKSSERGNSVNGPSTAMLESVRWKKRPRRRQMSQIFARLHVIVLAVFLGGFAAVDALAQGLVQVQKLSAPLANELVGEAVANCAQIGRASCRERA